MTSVYEYAKTVCLGLPETEEISSHGRPNFRIAGGKIFATWSINHHGDGKVALLLNMSRDMQQMLVESAPKHFFVPPYTGVKGWVGVNLNTGLAWHRVAELACDAYCFTAPARLAGAAVPVTTPPPTREMTPEEIDPYKSSANQKLLGRLRDICQGLPEVVEATQFGSPCFKAGKKTFCNLHIHKGRVELQAWVGDDRQAALISFDKRYRIPAYIGHNGWISFDLSGDPSWQEVETLIRESYRHFALKRMLKALDG